MDQEPDPEWAQSCLTMIKDTIEGLGEPMLSTPPMMYPEAIANLCSKRNRRLKGLCDDITRLFGDYKENDIDVWECVENIEMCVRNALASAEEGTEYESIADSEAFNAHDLTPNQRRCYLGLKKLAEEGKGLGMAGPDFVKKTVERIEAGEISEGEWFAIITQLLGIIMATWTRRMSDEHAGSNEDESTNGPEGSGTRHV